MNLSPDIIRTFPTNDDILLFQPDEITLRVDALDPEDDNLEFDWYVPGQNPSPMSFFSDQNGFWTSYISVTKSPNLDNNKIECHVWDGTTNVPVKWNVEVPVAGGQQ